MSFLLYLTGLVLVATVAFFVSLPLFFQRRESVPISESDPHIERWKWQKEEAYAALKEAEFDLQMGKLSEEDYRLLQTKYEARALEAIAQLDQIQARG